MARREVVILDFGSQYTHIIARRVRELHVYCEVYSCTVDVTSVLEPKFDTVDAVILSGGPFSVYDDGAPHASRALWDLVERHSTPVLGICYGWQEMAFTFGGAVERAATREYGSATLSVSCHDDGTVDPLFSDVATTSSVWMSHGDKVVRLPDGFVSIATTVSCELAAASNASRLHWGLQFHPEVFHTRDGVTMLSNFVLRIAHAAQAWTMASFLEDEICRIRAAVGHTGRVIGAVSGGVDSTVAAVMMNRAIGDRFIAVLVDNGLMRKGEVPSVVSRLRGECGVSLHVVDAADKFLSALEGVVDPEAKRKIIGHTFIDVFEAEAARLGADVEWLLQGTLYPDVIESVSFRGPSATIKSHHNVGGLVEHMHLRLLEPLRELFKDEVRELGAQLGLPRDTVWRHPFPGPGLAIRILDAVTRGALDVLRDADEIFIDELHNAGEYDKIAQAFAVLLPCRSVGVMGDGRTYEQILALRAVTSVDFMTADWYPMPYDLLARISTRIINSVRGVNRVLYDVSSKPPATVEFL